MATPETPFLQIALRAYRQPPSMAVGPQKLHSKTPPGSAWCPAGDQTRRSNLTVGPPFEVALYRRRRLEDRHQLNWSAVPIPRISQINKGLDRESAAALQSVAPLCLGSPKPTPRPPPPAEAVPSAHPRHLANRVQRDLTQGILPRIPTWCRSWCAKPTGRLWPHQRRAGRRLHALALASRRRCRYFGICVAGQSMTAVAPGNGACGSSPAPVSFNRQSKSPEPSATVVTSLSPRGQRVDHHLRARAKRSDRKATPARQKAWAVFQSAGMNASSSLTRCRASRASLVGDGRRIFARPELLEIAVFRPDARVVEARR